MRLMFMLSIAGAEKTIKIESPYFIPDPLLVKELVAARERGVQVEVIVPGKKIDAKGTRTASRAGWEPLLRAGIIIFEYDQTMIHSKLLIVDGQWASIGSSNFDYRSMRLNDEANLNVLDRTFAQTQTAMFERDKTRARPVSLSDWQHRPISEKVSAPFWSIFRSEL